MTSTTKLELVRLAHTIVWALFATCIIAIPILGYLGHFRAAAWLVGVVLVEVAILIGNGLRCPLTDIAACYTDDRRDNFDIYLPLWVARHNKSIFGTLFLAGTLYTIGRWAGWTE